MQMNRKEFYDSLSDEVKAKIKACQSEREMLKVLEEEQIELSPELLEGVAGGEPGPCIAFTCDKCEGNEADYCVCD
jgi:hypothetical protein